MYDIPNKIPPSFFERSKSSLSDEMEEAIKNSYMIPGTYKNSPIKFFEYLDENNVVKVVYENKTVFLYTIATDEEEDICYGVTYHKLNSDEILRLISVKKDHNKRISVLNDIFRKD